MKKILMALGALGMIIPFSTSVIACDFFGEKDGALNKGGKNKGHDQDDDHEESKDHHTGWDHNDLGYFPRMDFSTKSFEDLDDILWNKAERKLWGISYEIEKQGGFKKVIIQENDSQLVQWYSEVIFSAMVARAKVFLQTNYVIQYRKNNPDSFFLGRDRKTTEKKSYQFWLKGTQSFISKKLIPQVEKLFTSQQTKYLNRCLEGLEERAKN